MEHEIKTETEILDGIVKETYDYIEIEDKKVKHGLCKYYDYKGNVEEECFYKMGIKNGSAREYYNGKLGEKGNYKDGKKYGEWIIRNYKGEMEVITFIDGEEDEIYLKNKAIDKHKKMEILIFVGFVAIIVACIFQINSLFKKDFSNKEKENKEIEFPKQYEEKEIEEILEFPKKYEATKKD